jgi:tetratricopeptide (TPR) repeat protein
MNVRTRILPVVLFATASLAAAPRADQLQSAQAARPAAARPPAAPKPRASAASSAAFDRLAQQAEAAREAQRLDEANGFYEKGLKLRPTWVEGHWYLGANSYELDRYDIARDAFRRVVQLQPDNGAAWTFKGLCEFQLKNYDEALANLLRGRSLGIGQAKGLVSVARYHTGLLFNRNEQHEQALQTLKDFAQEGDDGPRIIEALGLAALRIPLLPADVPGPKREMVMLAGRAAYYTAARFNAAAKKAYEELVARYPEAPNVHYAYGVFLTGEEPDAAVEQYEAELKVSPRHPWAKMQLAFEYIRRGEWDNARPWAQQAVEEAPTVFVARRALGQVLLEQGDIEGAVRELEAGAKMAPDSAAMRFALARAYRRAGRSAEAEREQIEFARLDRISRTQRQGAQSVGGIELDSDSAPSAAPQP